MVIIVGKAGGARGVMVIIVGKAGGARGIMVIVVGNGHSDPSSNLDETDCISHSTKTLGKGMNPIILPPAMGK